MRTPHVALPTTLRRRLPLIGYLILAITTAYGFWIDDKQDHARCVGANELRRVLQGVAVDSNVAGSEALIDVFGEAADPERLAEYREHRDRRLHDVADRIEFLKCA